MFKKWSIVVQTFLFSLAVGGSIYIATTSPNTLMRWYSIDDAFYYFKVAQNVLTGHGWTFDGINLTNGYHPLWMLVCLCVFWLSKFSLLLPLRVLIVVSGLFNAASAVVLFRFLQKHVHPAAAITGAFLWALMPEIYRTVTTHGMESAISAFFLILLVNQASNLLIADKKINIQEIAAVGLIGALTILARLDNVFIVAAVGFSLLFKVRKVPVELIRDEATICTSIAISWILRVGLVDASLDTYSVYPMIVFAIFIKPMVYYFCEMYDGFGELKTGQKILRQIIAATVNLLLMYGIFSTLYALGISKLQSNSVIVIDALISSMMIFCLRLRQWKTSDHSVSPFTRFRAWVEKSWKEVLLNSLGYASPIVALIGFYIAYNKVVFGTFTPVSGQIKVWWNTLSNTVYSQRISTISLLGLGYESGDSPWILITTRIYGITEKLQSLSGNTSYTLFSVIYLFSSIVFLFLIIAILNLGEKKTTNKLFDLMIFPLLIGCFIQIAYYKIIGYQAIRSWYWVSEMLTTILMGSLLLDSLFVWFDHFQSRQFWSAAVSIILVSIICIKHANYISRGFPYTMPSKSPTAYISEVNELEAKTDPGSYIGMTGGGVVGYFIQDRTIVNLDGLINSDEYFNAMKEGTAQAFLDAIPLDYVYGKYYVLTVSAPYRDFMNGRLFQVDRIYSGPNFVLYRYLSNQ